MRQRRPLAGGGAVGVLVVVAAMIGGCSTAKQTNYLTDYSRLGAGRHVERFWADSAAIRDGAPYTIAVAAVDVARIRDQKGITASQCVTAVRGAIEAYGKNLRSDVLLDADDSAATAVLYVAVTEMTPGSAAGRIFAGELGMGHAVVQVEGRLVDRRSGADVVAFADRRRSSGAIGVQDLGGDAGPDLVRAMLDHIVADLARELQQSGL